MLLKEIALLEAHGLRVVRVYLGKSDRGETLAEAAVKDYWEGLLGVGLGQEKEVLHQSFFTYASKGIGLFFLLVLLLNFFLFDHYHQQAVRLQADLSIHQGMLEEVKLLEERLQQQQLLLSNGANLPYYVDRLAATIPTEVRLELWQVHPPLPKEEGVFEKGQLRIKGRSSAAVLGDWLKVLRSLDFVQSVAIEDFQEGVFELKLQLDEDELSI